MSMSMSIAYLCGTREPIYRHVHDKIEVTQGFHIFSNCSKKDWRAECIVVGRFL
jgi:hypothetical protein